MVGLSATENRLKRNIQGRKMTTRDLMTVGFWSGDDCDWVAVVEAEKGTKSAKVEVDGKLDVKANNAHCL